MSQQANDDVRFTQQLHQEALLKEYEVLEREAENAANWFWASTTIFLAAWVTGLSVVAANHDKFDLYTLWLLAGIAILAQLAWVPFSRRSNWVRRVRFLRQRQIEQELGLLKSHAVTVADKPTQFECLKKRFSVTQQAELKEFKNLKGRPPLGRWSLYILSFLVGVGWIGTAAMVTINEESDEQIVPTQGPTLAVEEAVAYTQRIALGHLKELPAFCELAANKMYDESTWSAEWVGAEWHLTQQFEKPKFDSLSTSMLEQMLLANPFEYIFYEKTLTVSPEGSITTGCWR